MKMALLVTEKAKQIVLTPETPAETAVLDLLPAGIPVRIERGCFYEHCVGGWLRQYKDDRSTMIFFDEQPKEDGDASADSDGS